MNILRTSSRLWKVRHLLPALIATACLTGPVTLRSEEELQETAESSTNAAPDSAEVTTGKDSKTTYRTRLRLSYDRRWQGDEEDSDFNGYFSATARDAAEKRLDIYASGRMHTDLDEPESTSLADDPFRSVDDSDGVTDDRLLQLYADVHTKDRRLALRGGRQYVEIADYLHMDGAQFTVAENRRLGGRIYAGHPVSYYTSVSGDLAGGLSVIGRPWDGTSLRLTVARYEDDSEDASDNNYYVDLRQTLSDTARLRGQVSLLDDEFRMAQGDLFIVSEDGETDLALGGSYWGSFDAGTRAYSPLYNVLGEQDPYTFAYARLTQLVVPKLYLSPGISLRFADGGDNEYNNRDYENYDLALIFEPSKAISASVAFQYWEVDSDDNFTGITGELRYRRNRLWEISAGTAFAEYTYDTYSDFSYEVNGGQTVFSEGGTVIEESPYVQTYFVRGKWKATRRLTFRAQFDVEDDDIAEDLAYRARASIEVRF